MFGFNPYSPYGMLPETMPQQGVLGQYPQNMRQASRRALDGLQCPLSRILQM